MVANNPSISPFFLVGGSFDGGTWEGHEINHCGGHESAAWQDQQDTELIYFQTLNIWVILGYSWGV